MKNHFRDHTWDIRVPRRLREVAAARNVATAELAQRLRHLPTTTELAGHLRVDRDTLAEAAYVAQLRRLTSLDGADPLDRPGTEDPGFARVDNRLTLRPLLATLPRREREILARRYFGEQTLAQIADSMGVSPMTVARLVRRSLTTLRAGLPP